MQFLYTDSKAKTGEGRHLRAYCETSEEPTKDPELWVITYIFKHSVDYSNAALHTRPSRVSHLEMSSRRFSGTAAASEFSEYQSGFRSCLANVNQYLLMAEHSSGSDRWMLSQLSNKLCRSRRRGDASSTTDSNRDQGEAQDEARKLPPSPAAPAEEKAAKFKPHGAGTAPCLHSEDARQSPKSKQAVIFALASRNTKETCSSPNKVHSVSHRIEAANTHHSVWRPW